ncbi:MAG: YigZ family protein, partial [Acidobacteriota bacterium]
THNCFAWRVGTDRDAARSSDDGEPSGTGGRPILQEIDGRQLTNLAVVVTRYYGGTKLGTGGLIRAYGGAAAAALDRAEVIETRMTETLRIAFAYDFSGAVQSVLVAAGLSPAGTNYGAGVEMEIAVPVEEIKPFEQALKDATRGRLVIKR